MSQPTKLYRLALPGDIVRYVGERLNSLSPGTLGLLLGTAPLDPERVYVVFPSSGEREIVDPEGKLVLVDDLPPGDRGLLLQRLQDLTTQKIFPEHLWDYVCLVDAQAPDLESEFHPDSQENPYVPA
jgi:hypothetical protein